MSLSDEQFGDGGAPSSVSPSHIYSFLLPAECSLWSSSSHVNPPSSSAGVQSRGGAKREGRKVRGEKEFGDHPSLHIFLSD
jgi:hypothetical protein